MNIKSCLIKKQLESLRMILHMLLNFRKPTDKLVVSCSQQLDEVIVKYHKIQAAIKKAA
ncbi:MAG: aspartyl-phosphate phosphatase Spo0E family protein [Clostridium sp.]